MAAFALVLLVTGCGLSLGNQNESLLGGNGGGGDAAGQESASADQERDSEATQTDMDPSGDAGSQADAQASTAGDSAADRDAAMAGDSAAAGADDGPGTMAMRALLTRDAGQARSGGGNLAANEAVKGRLADLEDDLNALRDRVASLEPAVDRWTDMEQRLETLLDALRKGEFAAAPSETPVPQPPPASMVSRGDPTQPPSDPALRGRSQGSGRSDGTASGGTTPPASGSSGDPDEIDTAGLHLVSYENRQNAGPGWQALKKKYSEQLKGLERRMATVTLPDGRTFHRLVAGPIDDVAEAQQRCQRLKERGQYCSVTDFVGTPG